MENFSLVNSHSLLGNPLILPQIQILICRRQGRRPLLAGEEITIYYWGDLNRLQKDVAFCGVVF